MDAEKALLGYSIPLYEVEEDLERDLAEEASLRYDMITLVNSLGSGDFKSVYISMMPHVAEQPIDTQRKFCYELLNKIEKVYHYSFPVNLDFTGEYSVSDLYKFLEFLEFDYIDFLAKVWKLLPTSNLRTINIESTCNLNSEIIVSRVDEVVKNNVFSKLVSLFLRTYTKEYLIEFIIEKSSKDRMLIFLKIQEGEENG
jgi:hypothetical protein